MNAPVGEANTWAAPLGSWVGSAQRAEEGVARPQGDGGGAGRHHADPHEGGRVVAGPRHELRVGEAVTEGPVRREPSEYRGRRHGLGQPLRQAGCRGIQRRRGPAPPGQVHEVHARPVATIDGRVSTGKQRGQVRADEMHPARSRPCCGLVLGDLADLWAREALERPGSGEAREDVGAPDGGGDLPALGGRCSSPSRWAPARARRCSRICGTRGRRGSRPARAAARRAVQVHTSVLLAGTGDGRDAARRRRPSSVATSPIIRSSASAQRSGGASTTRGSPSGSTAVRRAVLRERARRRAGRARGRRDVAHRRPRRRRR